jgi:hypothetical protein
MCHHLFAYQRGASVCLRCDQRVNDTRGLPHGHIAVNGEALTPGRLAAAYACPVCHSDINPRMVLGELRTLCAGRHAHDIEQMGRAIPKAKRDFIHAKQATDAVDVLAGYRRKEGEQAMPIFDLQDRATARLKRAGMIRLGVKKVNKNGKEYPFATDYFVLKDAPDLKPVYGEQPKRLNVWLPFNEIERNMPSWHQMWLASGLVCRGDGQRIDYAVNPKTGEVIVRNGKAATTGKVEDLKLNTGNDVACPGMAHNLYNRCSQCKPGALLIIMIREVSRLAYYQIATGSIHNIVNLTGQMGWYIENFGRLQGIPFVLELRPEKISTPSGKNGQRVRREKFLLNLEADPEWVRLQMAEMHRRTLPSGAPVAALPEPAEQVIDMDVSTVSGFDDEPVWEPPHENYDANGEAKTTTNGNGKERPLDPAALVTYLHRVAEEPDTAELPPVIGQKKAIGEKLLECFAGDDASPQMVERVLMFLWGVKSADEIKKSGQAYATLRWLLDAHPVAPARTD